MNVVREIKLMQAVNDRDHVRGPSTASIMVVHYGDFECPFSREGARVVKVLEGRFDGRLRIVFRHFPLTTKHPHAQQAAEAAEAAAAQGKFWEMAELLFANQRKLATPYLTRYAMELGMDTSKFDYDLATHAHTERIRADVLSGQQSGVTGTPTFFINGQRHEGSDDLLSLMTAMRLTPAIE
jgi:protein-disulfide isomerase